LHAEVSGNISLQVDCGEGVSPGSAINEVHVIGSRGGMHEARKICRQLSIRSKEAYTSSLSLFQACVQGVSKLR
jgi:hypothetical protein